MGGNSVGYTKTCMVEVEVDVHEKNYIIHIFEDLNKGFNLHQIARELVYNNTPLSLIIIEI